MFETKNDFAREIQMGREGVNQAPSFSIAQLASEFDLTTRTMRFYEEKGLLSPKRIGNRRIYNEKDRARLALVLHFREHGCALNDIAKIIELSKRQDSGVSCLEFIDSMFKDQLGLLERMSDEAEQQIDLLAQYTDTVTAQAGLRI